MPELPITYRGVVYPWHCDHMGHMNVMWYVGKFDEATWHLCALLGAMPSYLKAQNRAMVAAQQQIAYRRELLAGDLVTIRSGMLEMRDKSMRFFHEMSNDESGEIAAVTVLVGVHLDSQTRKPIPFPAEFIERGRAMLVDYDPLARG